MTRRTAVSPTSKWPACDSRVVPTTRLTGEQSRQMRALFADYFEGSEQFEADLSEKEWVILLYQQDRLEGFSTLMRLEGEGLVAFYSGDTIVSERARSGYELPRLWGQHVFRLAEELAPTPVYWFLLCSGYRTYRLLPVFFKSFYPCHDEPPASMKGLLEELALRKFPESYDAGVVRLDQPTPLREGRIPDNRLRDPHVAFFARANPGHELGDELACITRVSRDNLTPAGLRMLS